MRHLLVKNGTHVDLGIAVKPTRPGALRNRRSVCVNVSYIIERAPASNFVVIVSCKTTATYWQSSSTNSAVRGVPTLFEGSEYAIPQRTASNAIGSF